MGDEPPRTDDTGSRKSSAEWGEEYARAFMIYARFADRLGNLLRDLLAQADIDVIQVESRAKSVESFVQKIERKHSKYGNPLIEMTDLAALRVITYFREDLARVGSLIQREFTRDEENSVDKTGALRPAEFGYAGVHHVVLLNPLRRRLPEWQSFRNLSAEIQVRTIAQHAWAAIDHKLKYKSVLEIPDPIKRRFNALSATLQLIDDEFSRLRSEKSALAASYSASVETGDLALAMNSSSLNAYLTGTGRIASLGDTAREVGWTVDRPGEKPERDAAARRDLLTIVDAAGLRTIQELDATLAGIDDLRHELSSIADAIKRDGYELRNSVDDIAAMLVARLRTVPSDALHSVWEKDFARLLVNDGGRAR